MSRLTTFILERAAGGLLSLTDQRAAMGRFGSSLAEVEESALTLGVLPARYQRNRCTLTTDDQLALFRSRVAVVGCGGLGGYVIEQLARLGVGNLVVVDPDVFEEHNLNRQLLALPVNLGLPKVEAARQRVESINPAVSVTACHEALGRDNGARLLTRSHIVVDALDSIAVRLELADLCTELGLPLVHGAIGGWYGQVTTQYPGEHTLQDVYQNWREGKGVEQQLGNPAFTPAVIASLEVAEVCKVLLGTGAPLRERLLTLDLKEMHFHEL